jgi:hypothetical protein
MMDIPDDIYYRVLDLATELVNAFEAADMRESWELHNELREIVESEAAAGRPHPFLYETLADFTDDDRIAMGLYRTALELANEARADAYRASIQLAMAERYKNMGESELAYEYASQANAAAKGLDDLDLRKRISEFLLDESKNG